MTTEQLHAPLAPSDAARWAASGGCRGAPAMQRRYPEPDDGEEAREGTAAHHYMAETLLGRPCPVGTLAPNGVPIDSDMVENARDLITDIRDTMAAQSQGLALRVEERVDMSTTIHPDNWGTPDAYLLDTVTKNLFVWDYKYGHKFVDAFKNYQLIDYAIGILECNGVPLDEWHGWRIHLTVAQPRNFGPGGPLREWYLGGAALRDYATAIRQAAHEASQPDAPLTAGDHCANCSAMVHCPANQMMVANCIDMAYRHVPVELGPIEVGRYKTMITAALARLKAIDAGVDAVAESLLRSGKRIGDGWGLEPTVGRERWTHPPEEIREHILMLTGVDIGVPKTQTPTQARKAGIDGTVISSYSERPSGAAKLVRTVSADTERVLGTR